MSPKGKDPVFSFSWSYENGGDWNAAQGPPEKGTSVDALGYTELYQTWLPSNPASKILWIKLIYMWNLMMLLSVEPLRKNRLMEWWWSLGWWNENHLSPSRSRPSSILLGNVPLCLRLSTWVLFHLLWPRAQFWTMLKGLQKAGCPVRRQLHLPKTAVR